ncbi:MAG: nucleotidyltransferase domain-containing protein [Clostridiales bacterium]|jgi:predicted nucleotidyltransferase|nr:nucleotidyltransferase domain-containing protein [Clostridiales bacterium]
MMLTHKKICDTVEAVAPKYNITSAYYFGSYAQGSQSENSDVDIMVEFDTPFKSLFTISALSIELEYLLGIPVDVLSLPLPEESHLTIEKVVKCYGR